MSEVISRPSQYLTDRAESLLTALKFFAEANPQKPIIEKHFCFMAQIKFWEWEVDNLLFSFETFQDRKEDWDETRALEESLKANGFLVKDYDLVKIRQSRREKAYKKLDVFAPIPKLKEIVNFWNELLIECEKHLRVDDIKNAIKFGAVLHLNLNSFRKELKEPYSRTLKGK